MIQSAPKTHTLNEFAENIAELSAEIKQSGQPLVLTVDGEEEFIVQDTASYHKLLEELDRAEAIAGIQRGLDDVANGRTMPLDEAFAEIRRQNGLPS